MQKEGLLIVISGPSGAGKGEVMKHTIAKYSNIKFSVSVTTRAPRKNEVDGVNYFFKTVDEYNQMVKNGEFLEHKEIYGNLYGTPIKYVQEQLKAGYDVVLEIDPEGALDVKIKYPNCVMIFITPEKRATIATRLKNRSTETEEQIKIRTQSALKEIKQAIFYDYVVINEDAEQGARDLISIIEAEKCKIKHNKNIFDNLILEANNYDD